MTDQAAFPQRLHAGDAHHVAQATWYPDGYDQLVVDLPPTADCPAQARSAARELLAGQVTAAVMADVLIVLCELVSNAIRHPVPTRGERVTIHLALSADMIRGEVCDAGGGFEPQACIPTVDDTPGGRGLMIVDRIASRWGAARELGTCVWFEFDR